MRFSILHISDLHRDLSDEVNNEWLLNSLERDFAQFDVQDPKIMNPSLCVVSGDLVYGVQPNATDAARELGRQYSQAEEFLIGLADLFFQGNRERIIILPGNHDVCYKDVIDSANQIKIPTSLEDKERLVKELFSLNSQLRWSWRELCFFRISDTDRYNNRLEQFASTYESFYEGQRKYSLAPEEQLDIFEFPDLSFYIVALNSCFSNDPLHRAGGFHPDTITEACRALRKGTRSGWLAGVTWHHSLKGGPSKDDYLDSEFLQLLIDAGVSIV